jgi:hypothetical protein
MPTPFIDLNRTKYEADPRKRPNTYSKKPVRPFIDIPEMTPGGNAALFSKIATEAKAKDTKVSDIRKKLTVPSDKEWGDPSVGMSAEDFNKLTIKENQFKDAGILGRDEYLENAGADESGTLKAAPGKRVYIRPRSRPASSIDLFAGKDPISQTVSQIAQAPVAKFGDKPGVTQGTDTRFTLTVDDAISAATIAYGGVEAVKAGKGIFDKAMAKSYIQRLNRARPANMKMTPDEIDLATVKIENAAKSGLKKNPEATSWAEFKRVFSGQAGKAELIPSLPNEPVSPKIAQAAQAAGQKITAGAMGLTKQPWQMTRKEALETIRQTDRKVTVKSNMYSLGKGILTEGMTVEGIPAREIPGWEDVILNHGKSVRQALSEGKPVPPEVLKDYPELAKKQGVKSIEKIISDIESGNQLTAEELKRYREYIDNSQATQRATIREEDRSVDERAKQIVFEQGGSKRDAERIARTELQKSQPMQPSTSVQTGLADVKGIHRPMTVDGGAARLDDLTPAFGEDIYSPNAIQYFGGNGTKAQERQALNIFKVVRGNPDAEVIVYRAVEKDIPTKKLQSGDWVTVNKQYAIEHGEGILEGNYKIIEQKVKASDLTTNADSFLEQGYYPQPVSQVPQSATVNPPAQQPVSAPVPPAVPSEPAAQVNTASVQPEAPQGQAAGNVPPSDNIVPPAGGGVLPPASPPASPAQSGAGKPPPSLSEMKRITSYATEMVKQDRPGNFTKIINRIPGLKEAIQLERPGLKMTTAELEYILIAHLAELQARVDIMTKAFGTRSSILIKLEKAFGKGATNLSWEDDKLKGKKLNLRFKGTPEESNNPITNTLKDVVENPELYELTEPQLQVIAELQERNTALLNYVVDGYGTQIGQFPAKPGGAFLSNVDVDEDYAVVIEKEIRAVGSGKVKERFYPTARLRMKEDKTFKPEINVFKLLYDMDKVKAKAASGETWRSIAKGKTEEEVIKETHPELYKELTELRETVKTLRDFKKIVGGLKKDSGIISDELDKAIFQFMTSDFENPYLEKLQTALDNKISNGVEPGIQGKELQKRINNLKEKTAKFKHAYDLASLKPYKLVQQGIYRYFPAEQAVLINELLKNGNNSFFNLIENIRGTAFSGDLSPVVGVQTPLGIFFDPLGALQQAGGGIVKAIKNGNPLIGFSVNDLAKDIKAEPEKYAEFFSLLGRSPGGTPEEYASGFLSKIPGFNSFTEATYTLVTKQAYGLYKRTWQQLVKFGIPELTAKVSAVTTTSRVYPFINPSRLGQSAARAAIIRALPTSYAFIRQPASMMADASKCIAKVFTFQKPSPTEVNSLRLLLQLAASLMITAALSQAIDAKRKDKDIKQAMLDAINPDPNNGKFLSIVVGNIRIPIGGPYRGLFRAIYPGEVEGIPFPVPFAGILQYFKNRMNPVFSTVEDLISNKDYYGKQIRSGDALSQVWQILEYSAENMLPLTAGAALEAKRTGATNQEMRTQILSQFAGTTLITNPMYEVNDMRDRYAMQDYGKNWDDLLQGERDELERNHVDLKELTEKSKSEKLLQGAELPKVYDYLTNQAIDQRNTSLNINAQALLDGAITKEDYDKQRGYIRPYYSGQRNALYQFKAGLDPEQARQIEEYYNETSKPEDKALSAYYDFYNKTVDASPVPKDWDAINAQLDTFLAQYDQKTRDYIQKSKDSWIQDLPEPARQLELDRLAGIEDESWWDNYSGSAKSSTTSGEARKPSWKSTDNTAAPKTTTTTKKPSWKK